MDLYLVSGELASSNVDIYSICIFFLMKSLKDLRIQDE